MRGTSSWRSKLTDWRFTVGVVSGGHFLSHVYNIAFPPLFPLLRPEFGLTNTQLGLLVTAVSIGGFLQVPVGVLVDRIGGKRLFLAAVGLTSLGIMLAGVAQSYYTILAFAVLSGIGQAAFHPADYALLDAATEGDNEGKSFGVHTFGGYAGFAVAPIVIGGLGLVYGWRPALLVTGAFGLGYVVFAALAMEPVHRRAVDPAERTPEQTSAPDDGLAMLFQPTILAMTAFFGIIGMSIVGVKSFAPILSVDVFGLAEGTANLTLTAFFAVAALSVLVGGVLADRFEPYRLIVANAVIATLLSWGIVSGLVAVGPTTVIVFFGALGLVSGAIFPSRDRLVNALAATGSTGKSFGLAYTGGTVGATVSPVVLGAVIDAGSPRLAFVLIGAFYLAGAVLVTGLGIRAARGVPRPAD